MQFSKIFPNPTTLVFVKLDGLAREYLTPAWAAKFTTILGFSLLNTSINLLLSSIE